MKKRLLKATLVILCILLINELAMMLIVKNENEQSIDSYFKNDSSFNYKSDFIIEIPDINLKTIVRKSSDDFKNLDKSLVYYKHNDYNKKIIIFGHSGMGYGTYFNRLNEVNYNNIVYLYKDNKKIAYKVDKKYKVLDSNTNILDDDKKYSLFLITCDKLSKNKRLVVELTLKSVETLKK